ncbi:C-terminal processing protease CtpA/Prc [Nonlabens dokdonensis]|uniref:Tricorn protease homolog n=2 Tax=Nonlabens dokdonensis TaxID=328515 RepID=L7WC50_NONDD|nr:S41 family peptidase [Nonlabens dokdonensis]AGC77674.1 putative peptidase/protease family protein [Nonlabens dokdonensis DSW-6]PZX39785.1 C-terminal processing protease CtpA/Prc [Nonlabens dokdonensis]
MKLFYTWALLLTAISLHAQQDAGWLRHNTISPDGSQIVFTYKGDLYKVAASGGNAQQLTFHEAHDYQAVWSKDGKQLAFASNRYGNFDVYVMNANGGPATRLTYHSANEQPFSFSHDNESVLFGAARMDDVKHRQFPTGSQPEVYQVPVTGGRVDQLFTIPAEYLNVSKDGKTILYHDKKGGENIWRKHHESSITRDIWSYDVVNNTHKMITTYAGEDRMPVMSGDEQSFYFLSERSGTFNIHKSGLNGTNVSQLTSFDLHPVRFLSAGNGTLCFSYDGKLYTMKEGQEPVKLQVNITTQPISNSDKFISINGGVSEMEVSPNGKEIAFIARGEVFVTSIEESFTKRITNTPEAERFVTWGPEGKSVVYSSERDGKWSVYKTEKVREEEPFFFASTLIKETAVLENGKDNYLATYSPDGKKLAFIEDRRTLKIKDVKSGDEITLMTPKELFHMRDGDKDFTWSPDSKWLLMGWDLSLSNTEVLLLAADGSKKMNLNESGYYDYSPQWVNGGKQMIWFSNRDGLKSYATSGSSQSDVYSMFFTQDAWDEFNLSKEEFALQKEIKKLADEAKKKAAEKDDKKKKKKKKDDEDKKKDSLEVKFDWDEMKDRTKRFTIHSSSLSDAVLNKDGSKLYYLTRFEDKLNLWETDLRTKETKMAIKLNASSGSLQWDKEMKNLFLLSNGSISKIDTDKNKKEGIKIAGEMEYDAVAERQAMFNHVWIRTNAIFYHPDFHGIDWNMMKKEYEKHLPYIGNSNEFTEMLSEMLGELNVSHAGAGGARMKMSNPDATASLGIFMDYNHIDDGIKITEVIKGGPLDKADFDVKAGMTILKIDGETISSNRDIASYLNRKNDKFTLLEINDPETKKSMTITVKPISLGEERGLLYKRWVKKNEEEVTEKSNGQLGYVHIPGMGDGPYRDIYEKMMGKFYDRKGMIVDTRFNGGGDLVADLAMFFTGTPFITYATEDKVVGGEPTSRWVKPTLAMINEAQYSDGHCFACGYTDLKIGKTVGMPTPGTCSFAGWEGLPDGSYWGVVPVSAKDINGKWMENSQTEPLIKVKNMPGKIDQGIDQQLERSIIELLKDVE